VSSPLRQPEAREGSQEMLRPSGDALSGKFDDVATTSSTTKTDDVTSSAMTEKTDDVISAKTSELEQGAGDFATPPHSTCAPDWMTKMTWAPRARMKFQSLRSHYDTADGYRVPMKARRLDLTPIGIEF
ncbi:hypothetical protein PMAYCL1PPCAC_10735, partial [Pristionchus mayeri]